MNYELRRLSLIPNSLFIIPLNSKMVENRGRTNVQLPPLNDPQEVQEC